MKYISDERHVPIIPLSLVYSLLLISVALYVSYGEQGQSVPFIKSHALTFCVGIIALGVGLLYLLLEKTRHLYFEITPAELTLETGKGTKVFPKNTIFAIQPSTTLERDWGRQHDTTSFTMTSIGRRGHSAPLPERQYLLTLSTKDLKTLHIFLSYNDIQAAVKELVAFEYISNADAELYMKKIGKDLSKKILPLG